MAYWQNRLTDHFERQKARSALLDEADKVSPCDGQDPGSVKQFLREMELLALEHRVLVFDKRARGSMLRTGMRWIQGHQDNPNWMAFKTHLLNSFVSADANNARRIDLQRCTRQPSEFLLSYNRRFCELAEDAYPGGRNAEQVELLVRLYATGLKDRTLAGKIITPGKPNTLEQAQQRVAATEQKADNMVWLGYEAMEVDAFAAPRPQQQRQEHTDVEKEVQILKTQYGKLEAKLDRLLEFNMRNPTATPSRVTTPRDDRQGVTCYYCGRLGHTQRECRTKQRDAAGPRRTAAPHSTAATTAPSSA
ncbi:hypothetical protein CAPTEDRAFT_201275 [Capitella teleta]|uniref:CCHC-type domain-containing protein n=1 Tax=Capitella teleta TaxID=283909 RepID=R7VAQ0_CAPTE|nr:hypothetical protein CAPTEDRAFT_201275 [Capitella teleta]|eukprot:ELU15612.1 hypothetical protein CAPTEDRAFT_201275 [Capitella teleta]